MQQNFFVAQTYYLKFYWTLHINYCNDFDVIAMIFFVVINIFCCSVIKEICMRVYNYSDARAMYSIVYSKYSIVYSLYYTIVYSKYTRSILNKCIQTKVVSRNEVRILQIILGRNLQLLCLAGTQMWPVTIHKIWILLEW